MATSQMSGVVQHLRKAVLLRDGAGLTDGQLLDDYISRRDEAAFAALMRRHGPMVWGVCCRVLHNHHDAEDAFQATFLVLVRKATSVVPRQMVGNWLYGVAYQTALKARAVAAKRKERERQVVEMPEPEAVDQDLWHDLQPLLDQELSRLPDRYRIAIVLCDLQGKTYKEAARQLACPEGTLSARLARGRTMLARRLAQRGVVLSGGALAAVLSQNVASAGVPTSVVSSTIQAATLFAAGQAAATGLIPVEVAALTEGVLKSMFLTKLKVATVVLLVVAALSGAAGLIYQTQAAEQPKAQRATEKADKEKQPAAKKDQKPKPDKEQLQGTWKIVSTVEDGEELKDDAAEVGEWTFKDTTVRIKSQPKDMKTGTGTHFLRFRLDETSNPKCIDLVEWEKDFDDADERKEGVYAIDGDTLRVCYSLEKGNRPTALESKQGSGYILIVLKRVNPKDEQKRDDKQKK